MTGSEDGDRRMLRIRDNRVESCSLLFSGVKFTEGLTQ